MALELHVLRCEKKYSMDASEAVKLRRKIGLVLPEDKNSSGEGYMVRSLYFDTIDNTDYMEKIEGYESRRKIRLRIYSPFDEYAKLEIKEKQGSLQRKRSLIISRADAMRLCKADYTPLLTIGTPLAQELYARMATNVYRPVCIVEYKRAAFTVPTNDIRITVDSQLRATESSSALFDQSLSLAPIAADYSAVLEVKYNGFLLSYVKDLLSLHGKPQSSNSKYCAARTIGMRNAD